MAGGMGGDSLFVQRGDDTAYGEDGGDLLDGGGGSNWLFGGDGRDGCRPGAAVYRCEGSGLHLN